MNKHFKTEVVILYFCTMIVLVIFIFVLLDLYIFRGLYLSIHSSTPYVKWLIYGIYGFLTLSFYIAFIGYGVTDYNNWNRKFRFAVMSLMILNLSFKLIALPFFLVHDVKNLFEFIYLKLSSKPTSEFSNKISRAGFLQKSGLILGGTMMGTLLWGMLKTAYNLKINRAKIAIKGLPDEFVGLKIAQISDMHLGSFATTAPIVHLVNRINELEADIVLFTGDLVNNMATEVESFKDILGNIQAKFGVFSSLGNHDYGEYVNWTSQQARDDNHRAVIDWHKHFGWDILLNEHRIIEKSGKKLAIIGVENWSTDHYFPSKGDLQKAYTGTEDAAVKILLSHDPSHWDAQVNQSFKDVHITFSGHTHGFQFGIEIPGIIKWSPSKYKYKQWAGLYSKEEQYIYVNRGVGFIGYNGRVGIQPEVALMELVKG